MNDIQIPYSRESDRGGKLFLGADPRTVRIRELAQRVARTDAPILIVGESGVGKEVLARFVHSESERARRPFVKINCAAVPHDLLESELFGHERGAFTGAHQRKEGKFELARSGTILLDEIGEMDLALQAKLLHVLEDSTITRVGGTQPVRMDTRVVATTNKPLEEAISRGEFRADLYFRLKVIRIEIPPLRERREDIPLLCKHFLQKYTSRQNHAVSGLPERLLEAFRRYEWPGNVRELQHVIQRYVILPDMEMVLAELAVTDTGNGADERAPERDPAQENGTVRASVDSALAGRRKIPLKSIAAKAAEDAEKQVILQVLQESRWNRKRAAARLDICYKTLLNKLERWDLDAGAAQPPATTGAPAVHP